MFSREASTVAVLSVLALCALARPARAQAENFDTTPAGALPPRWSTSTLVPAPIIWNARAENPRSAPNALVLITIRDNTTSEATSPGYVVPASGRLRLRFYKAYQLETRVDGMRLKMSVDGGPFTDIETAGGAFIAGGYTPRPGGGSYGYWTDRAAAYSETIAETPTLIPGQQVRFRWEAFFDNSIRWSNLHIDDVEVTAAAPPPPAIPTMTEWAMMLLGTALAGGTALHLNRRRNRGA